MSTETVSLWTRSEVPFYLLAALAGIATGWVDVAINDLLFTALLVLMACMLLGLLRPRRRRSRCRSSGIGRHLH